MNYELYVAARYLCAFSVSRGVRHHLFCVSGHGTGKLWVGCQNFEYDYRIRHANHTVAIVKVVWYYDNTFSVLYGIEAGLYRNSYSEFR